MLLTITNTSTPATELGFLLHKNPANIHRASLSFGEVNVFYPEADDARCTAAMLVTVNPIELVRGRPDSAWSPRKLEDYVNDRPYVSSSFTSVAISRVFGTALSGRSKDRTELVDQKFPLQAHLPVIQAKGGLHVLQRLFEPLGYEVKATPVPIDEDFPTWGDSLYFDLTLTANVTVHDLLSHLYVLLPVLDDEKHYFIGPAEVDKLLRHGEGWLKDHSERDFIVKRYLRSRPLLTRAAFERLTGEEETDTDEKNDTAGDREKAIEKPLTLHTQRLIAVAETLKALEAKRVIDLGCGEGKLLRLLSKDRFFEELLGMDVSYRSLELAKARLALERLPDRQRDRIRLIQGSLMYRDARLAGYDAAAVVEVIEHLDAPRLASFERVLFEFAAPQSAIVTTPNREYNANFPTLPPGQFRHSDHRFEWTRSEFESWAQRVAATHRYAVRFQPIGPFDETLGAPSQMAVFTR